MLHKQPGFQILPNDKVKYICLKNNLWNKFLFSDYNIKSNHDVWFCLTIKIIKTKNRKIAMGIANANDCDHTSLLFNGLCLNAIGYVFGTGKVVRGNAKGLHGPE